jgi:hypothetical protein
MSLAGAKNRQISPAICAFAVQHRQNRWPNSSESSRTRRISTDTRTLQGYVGHRSIQSTVRYTELAPGRFKNIWR